MTYEPRAWVGHHIANRRGWGAYVDVRLKISRDAAALVAEHVARVHALVSDRGCGDSRYPLPCNAETAEGP